MELAGERLAGSFGKVRSKALLGENQLSLSGNPQAVIASRVLDDDRLLALKPITAGLATLQGQYVTDWPVIVAGALIGTLPTLLVFLFLQRYFIEGLTLGSTK